MKVSGFTFIRNGTLLGYPYVESIKSILPICDEFVVAVGDSEDETLNVIKKIKSKKIRVIPTCWNENMQDRGFVYAQQKMIALYNCTGDWAFYLEGDEVIHEKDLPNIKSAMEKNLNEPNVEALAFRYHHFFGSKNYIAKSPAWYRSECRIIKNNIRIWSPDALYFLVMHNNKKGEYPKAKLLNAHIYHYGHVRKIHSMREKNARIGKYWKHSHPVFSSYKIDPKALKEFNGTHPIAVNLWLKNFSEHHYTPSSTHILSAREIRHRILMAIENLFNLDLTSKHFKNLDL
jgi:glycosyltransferase involved in cell wall biosynthesis